mmetsp:Transcript_3028/g.10592  ORF Transcript_3028/g.10592 Transcript_3028/m.10592 type:complete len:211 (-) Transcript_3028:216-848(-)
MLCQPLCRRRRRSGRRRGGHAGFVGSRLGEEQFTLNLGLPQQWLRAFANALQDEAVTPEAFQAAKGALVLQHGCTMLMLLEPHTELWNLASVGVAEEEAAARLQDGGLRHELPQCVCNVGAVQNVTGDDHVHSNGPVVCVVPIETMQVHPVIEETSTLQVDTGQLEGVGVQVHQVHLAGAGHEQRHRQDAPSCAKIQHNWAWRPRLNQAS